MFSTFQNSVELRFTLIPDGPILVRAQSVGIDPGLADMEFHRTHRNGRSTVFLAGSGLKGVLRSHGERLLRSSGRFACDPTRVREATTCGHSERKTKLGDNRDPKYPHAGQCGACFTFGSLYLAGRFRVDDAYPTDDLWDLANQTEVRAGVGIERKSQASSHGVLYDTEVVVGGGFEVRISGENFSLWQLGLVLAALDHLDAGLVRIGGCKARGMGRVKVRKPSVKFRFLNDEEGSLTGSCQSGADEFDYSLPAEDSMSSGSGCLETSEGLFRTVTYEDDAVQVLSSALQAEPLAAYLKGGA